MQAMIIVIFVDFPIVLNEIKKQSKKNEKEGKHKNIRFGFSSQNSISAQFKRSQKSTNQHTFKI